MPSSWTVDPSRPAGPTPPDQMAAKDLLNGRVRFRVPSSWQRYLQRPDGLFFVVPYPFRSGAASAPEPNNLEQGFPMVIHDATADVRAWLLPRRQSVRSFSADRRHAIPGERILQDLVTPAQRVVVGWHPDGAYTWSTFDCYRTKDVVGVGFHLEYDLKQDPVAWWKAATDADARAVCASITIDER